METKITKREAIDFFRQLGYSDLEMYNTTFAAKNSTQNIYWANPPKNITNNGWYIILHDTIKGKMHLFYIPPDIGINKKLKIRIDKPTYFNINIDYFSHDFRDNTSGFSFSPYKCTTCDLNIVDDNTDFTNLKKAVELFNEMEYDEVKITNTSFSIVDSKQKEYLLQPSIEITKHGWHIILVDYDIKKAFLFYISPYAEVLDYIKIRNNNQCLNIKISAKDNSFIDLNSGISFADYLITEIDWS